MASRRALSLGLTGICGRFCVPLPFPHAPLLLEKEHVQGRRVPSTLYSSPSTLWSTPGTLCSTASTLCSTPGTLWSPPSTLCSTTGGTPVVTLVPQRALRTPDYPQWAPAELPF